MILFVNDEILGEVFYQNGVKNEEVDNAVEEILSRPEFKNILKNMTDTFLI